MAMFVGLVDGDGYIEIGARQQKQYNKLTKILVKSTIRARLVIRLHNRDEALLRYLTTILGVGSISNLVALPVLRTGMRSTGTCKSNKINFH
jgi:hypothetical protein